MKNVNVLDFSRTAVIGCAGSGKTTFSLELGKLIGKNVVHLDKELWQSGWVLRPDRAELHKQIIAGESWLIDGMWGSLLLPRFARATLVIFFDYPTWLCVRRAEKRRKRGRGTQRFDMAEGCIEGDKDKEFISWIRRYRKTTRPKVYDLANAYPTVDFVVFKTPRQATRFLKKVATGKDFSYKP